MIQQTLELKAYLASLTRAEAKGLVSVDAQGGIVVDETSIPALKSADTSIKNRLGIVESGLAIARIVRPTWSSGGTADTALSLVPLAAGTNSEVLDGDTGTHTGVSTEAGYDALTGKVPNSGTYLDMGSPLARRRVGPSTAKATANQIVGAAPLVTLLADDAKLLIVAADGTTIQQMTGAALKAQIQDIAMPRQYTYPYAVALGTTGQRVADFDAFRSSLSLINSSLAGTIIVNVAGGDPVEGAANCHKLVPQSFLAWDLFETPTAAITAKSDTPGAILNITTGNPTGIAPDIDLFLSNMPSRVASAERLRMGILRGSLMSCGFLDAMDELHVYINTYSGNALVNWANPAGVKATLGGTTPPTFTANSRFTGTADGFIDTGIPMLSGKYQRDSNSMFTLTDLLLGGSAQFMCGFGGGGVQANRTDTQFAVRSSAASSDLVTLGSASRWTGFSRTKAEEVIAFRDDLSSVIPTVSTTQSGRNQMGLANNSASGATSNSNRSLLAQAAGRGVPDAVQAAARVALLTFASSAGAI